MENYERKYSDVSPTIPAGQAYDAAALALKLHSENNGDKSAILKAMKDVVVYEGVSGKIMFDETRRATFPLSIFEIQNGEIKKMN